MRARDSQTAIYFISGSDEASVKKAALELVSKLAPAADAFGLETIDGAVETVDAAVEKINDACRALMTFPFLGGKKLVWLKNATFLGDTPLGRSESVTNALAQLCEILKAGLPEDVTFLMSAPEADKRRSAFKQLSKMGVIQLHDKPDLGFRADEEEIISWTAQQAHARGLKISHEAVEALAARVGLNTRQLDNELQKLETAFGHGHSIGAADVRSLVAGTRESGIFDISNAILARDLPLALETLAQLIRQGERGISILLAAIVPTVRNLLLVKDLMAKHKLQPPAQPHFFASSLNRLESAAIAHLPRKKDGTLNTYPLGIAARSCVHYTTAELEQAFHDCADANLKLVTTQIAEDVVLSRLLIRFMAR